SVDPNGGVMTARAPTSSGGEAARRLDVLAGNPPGLGAGKERDHVRDVSGRAQAAQGGERGGPLKRFRGIGGATPLGVGRAGRDDVGGDAPRAELVGGDTRDLLESGLA